MEKQLLVCTRNVSPVLVLSKITSWWLSGPSSIYIRFLRVFSIWIYMYQMYKTKPIKTDDKFIKNAQQYVSLDVVLVVPVYIMTSLLLFSRKSK